MSIEFTISPPEQLRSREKGIPHNCGIAGVWAPGQDVGGIITNMLYNLNHRGQEGAGMVIASSKGDFVRKGSGLAREVIDITHENPVAPAIVSLAQMRQQKGHSAIAQIRYSTAGSGKEDGLQPFYDKSQRFSLVHNGNFVNVGEMLEMIPADLREEALTDSWIAHQAILASKGKNLEEKIAAACSKFSGAYSLIMQSEHALYGLRDPWGMKPLILAQLPNGGVVLSSEPSVLRSIGAKFVRHVERGEGVVIDDKGIRSFFQDGRTEKVKGAFCSFEYVYIARPDSMIEGKSVSSIRQKLGSMLAEGDAGKFDPENTVVVGVQDSATVYAQAYSHTSGIEQVTGLVKNNYAPIPGRIFQMPGGRERATALKHGVDPFAIAGKHVILVDDSLVRGTTMRGLIKEMRTAHESYPGLEGPASIEVRIASPMIMYPCYYGVDFSTRTELAHDESFKDPIEAIRQDIGADSLRYITPHQLVSAISGQKIDPSISAEEVFGRYDLCGHCFTGRQPIPVESVLAKRR